MGLLSLFVVPALLVPLIVDESRGEPLRVFPGAEGFGTFTVAGSGRNLRPPFAEIFRVSNLEDRGPGSLRACVEASMPRTCVFEVGGEVRILKALRVTSPYLTVAGQTAPAPGILITGGGFQVQASEVLLQHLEIRPGDRSEGPNPVSRDAVTVGGEHTSVHNVVLDHLSLSWALDENLDITGKETSDVTVSSSLVAEGLDASIHPKGPHSKGILVSDGVERFTLVRSVLAHNVDRNPYLKPGVFAELVNNIIYDWGGRSGSNVLNVSDYAGIEEPVRLNLIGNLFLQGPSGPSHRGVYGRDVPDETRIYASGNISPKRRSTKDEEWSVVELPEDPYRVSSPLAPRSNVRDFPSSQLEERVLTAVGARPAERSRVDARIVEEVRGRSGTIKDCVEGCSRSVGGWPVYPTTHRELRLPKEPFSDDDKDGYTNLEAFLFEAAARVETGSK